MRTQSALLRSAAAKMFNVISSIEAAGIRVELHIACAVESHNSRERAGLTTIVKIKSADQPFNVLSMCYPVVHPSYLRRHMFAAWERANAREDRDWSAYGQCSTPVLTDKHKESKIIHLYDLIEQNQQEEDILKTLLG